MSSGNVNSALPFDVSELIDESDFDQLVSPDGHVSICGFGSLLSERSARSTFPDLINFRVARLNGFRRVFAHVAPIFFDRGIAIAETKVLPEALDGKQYTSPAVLCARYSDEEYFQNRCKDTAGAVCYQEAKRSISNVTDDMTFTRSGETISCLAVFIFGTGDVLAAKNLGDAVYNNFLDHTFLGDRCTTIREYLATTGSSIMDEEPPELLKIRYGG
ncbi:hypothetical protein RJ640_014756 [Escallonia rubra]|uniref:Uncharacterized protein n=1 Tax=Escallonia rubra TaxID=112253 RepID=A0AA88RIF4_9ASTE|nr:hypothetical protein RJ640_014756 [Escallonia rubra]